jgi:hypothetical protein
MILKGEKEFFEKEFCVKQYFEMVLPQDNSFIMHIG